MPRTASSSIPRPKSGRTWPISTGVSASSGRRPWKPNRPALRSIWPGSIQRSRRPEILRGTKCSSASTRSDPTPALPKPTTTCPSRPELRPPSPVSSEQSGNPVMTVSAYTAQFFAQAQQIIEGIDQTQVDAIVETLVGLRESGGRLFFLGVGGSAGNCGHAVNDFRKIAGFEAYAPTDNVSELTARTNDDGWETVFVEWLKTSRLRPTDALFIFSVGGGSLEKNVSPNLVRALQYAKEVGAQVLGIVGRDGGYTAKVGDAVVVIPTVNPETITPHTEAFQAVVWHLLVSHPSLKARQTKWESAVR